MTISAHDLRHGYQREFPSISFLATLPERSFWLDNSNGLLNRAREWANVA